MNSLRRPGWLVALALLVSDPARADFTPLTPLPPPGITAAAEAFSDSYAVANIVRPPTGPHRPDYASRGLGEKTFIDFDLGTPVAVAAFEHIQRRTPDTIAEAELIFSDAADFRAPIARVPVRHVDEPGATTLAAFPPVTARYVRWQVTRMMPGRSQNPGGQGIRFFRAGTPVAAPGDTRLSLRGVPIAQRDSAGLTRPVVISLDYPYAEPVKARLLVDGQPVGDLDLGFGTRQVEHTIAAGSEAQTLEVSLEIAGQRVTSLSGSVPPVPRRTVYILPHSHTDIGYTAIQTDIEEKQVNNLVQGLAEARRTASYPEGARFVWNVEVTWAADLFLQRLPKARQEEFLRAVKTGEVSLNGMYLNELTGLCRPEELVRLFRFATELGRRTGVPVDSAMISDVPGYTWGTVTAMAAAGIRYFSVAPNYFDRIGTILVEWENKPFWWVGPDGQSKVLVWIPFWGYAMSHRYGSMSKKLVLDFCEGLESRQYPYDIAYVRWAGHGDNAVPDASICDFVRDWNAAHAWPRFVISSTSEAFRAFEERHGAELPVVRGDWTPYWEDGAGSSAAETAMNRASSERLTQAEAVWAMADPERYPVDAFEAAWNNVLLYSEHTWGAHCSISEPAIPFTTDQWNIKQSYATTANLQSRQLLNMATQGAGARPTAAVSNAVDVFNTASWTRSGLALLPQELSGAGSQVTDLDGSPRVAQRLAGGELAVRFEALPPYSARRILISNQAQATPAPGDLRVEGTTLENRHVRVQVDEQTGAIRELRLAGLDVNLVDGSDGHGLNDYLYLLGDQPSALQRNPPPRITVRDRGPLVASLRIESTAPGCYRLVREVRLTADSDEVELFTLVDKRRIDAANYFAPDGKESVNFAFPFQVPEGEMRIDIPFGVFRPEADQMPSACKNWLTVGRWVDVSNRDYGVTWVTLDAPLIQVGGVTATLLNSQTNPEVWRKKIDRTQKLYVWAMNNHWGTNYRAHQDGAVTFRFVLRPHRGPGHDAEHSRVALAASQPLIALPGRGPAPSTAPLLQVSPPEVIVTALKPSDDGKAWMVRLLGVTDRATQARLMWDRRAGKTWLSDVAEQRLARAGDTIEVPPWGLVTVRVERR